MKTDKRTRRTPVRPAREGANVPLRFHGLPLFTSRGIPISASSMYKSVKEGLGQSLATKVERRRARCKDAPNSVDGTLDERNPFECAQGKVYDLSETLELDFKDLTQPIQERDFPAAEIYAALYF